MVRVWRRGRSAGLLVDGRHNVTGNAPAHRSNMTLLPYIYIGNILIHRLLILIVYIAKVKEEIRQVEVGLVFIVIVASQIGTTCVKISITAQEI